MLDPSGVRDVASKPRVSLPGPVPLATSSLLSVSDHPVMGIANKSVFCFCFLRGRIPYKCKEFHSELCVSPSLWPHGDLYCEARLKRKENRAT